MTAKQLKDIHNFKQEGDESLYQAWEWNIRSGGSSDGLVALVNKLDNLGRDMKKLKESVHAIQVGCQICEGPHLDKDCPLAKEVKQIEKVRYGEFCLLMGTMEEKESPWRSTKMEVWIKKLQENAEINTRNQYASLKKLETQIEQLTEELCSRKEKSKQAKEENTNDQLPTKESNPGHVTHPYTIGNFNFYDMANLGASVNVLPRNIFEYLELTNLSETKMLVEIEDMRKKAPLGIGIKSLQEDGDNLKDFRQISNLEAMLREFLVLILLYPHYFTSLMYNRDIVQFKWGMGVELILDAYPSALSIFTFEPLSCPLTSYCQLAILSPLTNILNYASS
ncbi:hypothetical protein Tco_1375748 [Tanacetum coccineum]